MRYGYRAGDAVNSRVSSGLKAPTRFEPNTWVSMVSDDSDDFHEAGQLSAANTTEDRGNGMAAVEEEG